MKVKDTIFLTCLRKNHNLFMLYICCYDISDARRLRSVAKELGRYALRCQKSIFVFEESEKMKIEHLIRKLQKKIDKNKDSLLVIPLCQKDSKKVLTLGLSIAPFFQNHKFVVL